MTITIKKIGDTADLLGESPIWDSKGKCLYWVDSVSCLVKCYDPITQEYKSWKTHSQIGCIGFAPNNCLIVSLVDGFYELNLDSGEIKTLMRPIPPNDKVRFNDGKIDRFGNFICGSMGIHTDPLGELYRMNRDGESKKLANGIRISNCIAFSPNGKVMYMADSLDLKIRAYDYGDGNQDLLEPRIFFDTSGLGSAPDGATVDAEGYLWVALVSANKIARFAPNGTLDRLIRSPTDFPSCLAFGGDDLSTLYVTSIKNSGTGRMISRHPEGGYLFAIDGLGVKGLPEPCYQQSIN